MNILSWAALAVLVYYAFKGWRRGLIMTVFSMFATVIAIALAAQLSPQLSQNWQNTAYFDAVSQRVEASLFKNQDEQEDTDKEHMIDRLPLPDIVQQALANSDDTQKDVLGISAFKAYIANCVTELIFNALSFVLVFFAVSVIMKIIIRCLNLLSRLPVIHTMNKMGGMLVGLLKGMIILWVICIVITILSGTEMGGYLFAQINESLFLRYIYDHNYIMMFINGFKDILWG